MGLGPRFRLTAQVDNIGTLPTTHASALFVYDRKAYHFERPLLDLPALAPNVSYAFDVMLLSLAPGAKAPPVQVSLVREQAVLITASVEMPVVEAIM